MIKKKYTKTSKLVNKVKEGDSQAFAELYSLTYQKVYLLALSILKKKSMAEDITQEVFINVLESINTLENPKLFIAWVNKITYTHCIHEIYKRKKLKEVRSDNILPIMFDELEDNDPLNAYISKEDSIEFMHLINKLTRIQSTILVLKYFEGLKISEIAYILDIPEGTVKSRLNKAKKKFQKLYISETKKRKHMYAFTLQHLFKDMSNDNVLDFNSSKNILNNILFN